MPASLVASLNSPRSMPAIHAVHLEIEVRDHDVEPAVGIVVAGVDTHSGTGFTVCRERDTGCETDLGELPLAVVVKQEVRHRIVGDEDVRPTVVVVVGDDDPQPVPT